MEIEERIGNQPCQAVCAAVCACHGLLHYEIEDYSFDAQKFINFLEGVSGLMKPGVKTYLFLDNCSVHHSHATKPHWERLDLIPIWNVAYCFKYNSAIEMFWAQVKALFRPILLEKML